MIFDISFSQAGPTDEEQKLMKDVEEAIDRNATLSSSLIAKEQEKEALQKALSEKDAQRAEVEKKLAEKEKEVEKLKSDVAEVEKKNAALEQELKKGGDGEKEKAGAKGIPYSLFIPSILNR